MKNLFRKLLKSGPPRRQGITRGPLRENYGTPRKNYGTRAWNPDSITRTLFDVISMLVVLFDAFAVPFLMAWLVDTTERWPVLCNSVPVRAKKTPVALVIP